MATTKKKAAKQPAKKAAASGGSGALQDFQAAIKKLSDTGAALAKAAKAPSADRKLVSGSGAAVRKARTALRVIERSFRSIIGNGGQNVGSPTPPPS